MEHITEITPAYDKRKENMGIHCCELRMILKGKLGATQFVLYTGWFLQHNTNEIISKGSSSSLIPYPADIGYHSPNPMYEGQDVCCDSCKYLDGKPCYYGDSCLEAKEVYKKMLEFGSDAVWEYLEKKYITLFGELK